jgi:hypothetical protein
MRKLCVALSASLLMSLASFAVAGSGAEKEIKNQKMKAKTLSALSASQNKKGDKFTLQVLEPDSYKGAIVEGEVTRAKASGKVKGKSELLFSFNTLTPAGGQSVPIEANLESLSNTKGAKGVDEEGRVIGNSSMKKDVARTAILGGIGAAIGGIAGGGSGAAKGAAIGAAIGLTIAVSTSGPDIKIAPGSVFDLVVTSK